jgi:hypothetical protein
MKKEKKHSGFKEKTKHFSLGKWVHFGTAKSGETLAYVPSIHSGFLSLLLFRRICLPAGPPWRAGRQVGEQIR